MWFAELHSAESTVSILSHNANLWCYTIFHLYIIVMFVAPTAADVQKQIKMLTARKRTAAEEDDFILAQELKQEINTLQAQLETMTATGPGGETGSSSKLHLLSSKQDAFPRPISISYSSAPVRQLSLKLAEFDPRPNFAESTESSSSSEEEEIQKTKKTKKTKKKKQNKKRKKKNVPESTDSSSSSSTSSTSSSSEEEEEEIQKTNKKKKKKQPKSPPKRSVKPIVPETHVH